MLTFKHWLKCNMNEELLPHQKWAVDKTTEGAKHIGFSKESDAFFHPDNKDAPGRLIDEHTRVIPYTVPPHIPSSVKDYLNASGYDIHDYNAGLAKNRNSTSNNTIKIGRVLSKPHPIPHMEIARQDAHYDFITDESRGTTKEHEIMITRHPHRVAEMSTNKGWTSCLDIGNCVDMIAGRDEATFDSKFALSGLLPRGGNEGVNSHFIPKEINAGTHVAYLINKGDHALHKPIARVKLTPYQNQETGHVAYSPSATVYSSRKSPRVNDAFRDTVNDIAKKHIGPRTASMDELISGTSEYKMAQGVYPDNDPRYLERDVDHQSVLKELRTRLKTGMHLPVTHLHYMGIKGTQEDARDILDRYGKSLSLDTQKHLLNIHNVGSKILDIHGTDTHPDIQHMITYTRTGRVIHHLVKIFGKNLHHLIQNKIAADSEAHEATKELLKLHGKSLSPKFQASAAAGGHGKYLIDTLGKDLDAHVQRRIARSKIHGDPATTEYMIDTLGKDLHPSTHIDLLNNHHGSHLMSVVGKGLHPDAQHNIVRYGIPALRSDLIKTMGKDLHPDFIDYLASNHTDSHQDLIDHVGDAIPHQTRTMMDQYAKGIR